MHILAYGNNILYSFTFHPFEIVHFSGGLAYI